MKPLSLSLKLNMLAGAGIFATVVVAGIGNLGLRALTDATSELERSVVLQRSQMMADMQHDALSGAILRARLDARTVSLAAADEKAVRVISDRLLSSLDSVAALTDDVALARRARAVRTAAAQYCAAGVQVLADLSGKSLVLDQHVASFDAQFSNLEQELDALGDLVETSARNTADRAAARGAQASAS